MSVSIYGRPNHTLNQQTPGGMLQAPEKMAGLTGLEPAASGVTGRRSNQLNYNPKNDKDMGRAGLEPTTLSV